MMLTKDLLPIALMESNISENLNGCSSAEKRLTPKYAPIKAEL